MNRKYSAINNLLLLASLLVTVTFLSCSKWDDYKQYTTDGEVAYSGKVDSAKAYPGFKRVRITGKMNADPKVTTIKIFWNNKQDSVTYDAKNSIVNGQFDKTFPVAEGIANFTIHTYDAAGNRSVPVYTSSTIYGDTYQNSLSNRLITNAELLSSGNVKIDWADVNKNDGVIGMKVSYTNAASITKDTVILSTSATALSSTLPQYKAGTKFQYSTLYKPDANAIDTFYSAPQTAGVKYDATSLFLKNAGPNFANSDGGNGRWQVPAEWTTTDDVKNGGGGMGGLDNGNWLPSKALSIEAWWGMPVVTNGKIYQTATLPAGKYEFTITTGDCSDGDDATKYMTVAAGKMLPDIASVQTSALAYKTVTKFADQSVKFELTAPSEVSMGIQAMMPAHGNFMKVFKVRLYGLP